jgi:hypothetical protein
LRFDGGHGIPLLIAAQLIAARLDRMLSATGSREPIEQRLIVA